MTTIEIPGWVKMALDDAISAGNYTLDRFGRYVFPAMQEVCGRFDCTLDVWQGTICVDDYEDHYNGETDPTRQNGHLTWRNLNIVQV